MNKVSEKIISDSEKIAEEIIRNSEKAKIELIRNQEKAINSILFKHEMSLEELYEIELKRLKSINRIETKKNILRARRDIITELMGNVSKRILEDAGIFIEFIRAMIIQGVLTGNEEILISGEDENIITGKFIKNINAELEERLNQKMSLKLSMDRISSGRGVVLKEGRIEYNAILNNVIKEIVDEYEPEISKMLFANVEGELSEKDS